MTKKISGGVAHVLPQDLRQSLSSDPKALATWESLTPLARNEWICWVMSVKTPETRREHVERVCSELNEGMRRPCCWMGCVHRRDKSLSPSQKYLLAKRSKRSRQRRRHRLAWSAGSSDWPGWALSWTVQGFILASLFEVVLSCSGKAMVDRLFVITG